MSAQDKVSQLNELLPQLGDVSGHPEIAGLIDRLLNLVKQQLDLHAQEKTMTDDEIAEQAGKQWEANIGAADELKKMKKD